MLPLGRPMLRTTSQKEEYSESILICYADFRPSIHPEYVGRDPETQTQTIKPNPVLGPCRRQRQFVVGSGPEAAPGLFRAVRCEPPSLTLRRPYLHMTWLYFLD